MRDLRITIRAIPHGEQPHPTAGSWSFDDVGDAPKTILHIKVSQLSDWRREALVGLHELLEALICKHKGITKEQIDEFDMNFEANRVEGDDREPADDPRAPHHAAHRIATALEGLFAVELGVDWVEYEHELMTLP